MSSLYYVIPMRTREKKYPDFITSVRIPFQMYEELDEKMAEKNFTSISEAMRSYTQLGLWVERIKHEVDNPEFLAKIDSLKQGNALFDWTQTLTEDQARAIRDAVTFELEQRVKQVKFI